MDKKVKAVIAPRRDLIGATVAAIIAGALSLPIAQSVYAADAAAASDELSEVVVTGSRIQRRDTEANSPLVTVDAAALENKSGLNVENYLNQLPAYNPASSPNVEATNSDVQISSINSVGIASISLRGFGANRSLTLIDGRRAVPTNALMVVDINSIPSSMIQRVEIISGGASATYGADAIGGVSNFMLRRNFQGLELDAQWGQTEVGDNQETRFSAIMGSSIGDGRGNLVFASEYYERKAALDKNRDFYTAGYADPTVTGNFLGFVFGANGYAFSSQGGSGAVYPGNAIPTGGATTPGLAPSAYYPSVATLATIMGKGSSTLATRDVVGFPGTLGGSVRFNPDGTFFDPNGNNQASWKGAAVDGMAYGNVLAYNNAVCNSTNATVAGCPTGPQLIQQLKYNEIQGYTSSPQTRYSFMGSGTYDITDDISFMASARFAESTTRTFLAGTNASFGWEVSVPYNPTTDSPVNPALDYTNQAVVAAVLANPAAFANPGFIGHGVADPDGGGPGLGAQHPVPVQMAILLNSRPVATRAAPWIMETYPLNSFGRRATLNVNQAWQIETGLTYKTPIKDWTAEAYYSRGQSSTYNIAEGNNSLARWRAVITAPDYGRNSALQSNRQVNGPGANPGFGANAVPCTSGFYETIFNGDARPTDDCLYAVQAKLQTRTQNQQDIAELNLQGGLFELPAGEVRAALGYQRRRNSSQFNPDILQSTASLNDQVIGVYPTGYLDQTTTAKDVFGEVLVPVFSDFLGIKKFELELGGRYSSYDKTDSTTTYKINGNVQINDWIRFRGGYNRATRAPNLGELFLPQQQIFAGGGVYGDPCGVASNSPFGAGGSAPNPIAGGVSQLAAGQTTEGARSAYLICQAQMGTIGSQTFYSSTQPAAAGGGFAWINQIGNANLDSEKADTWTAGVVLRSPFENALASNITATIDWYQIAINDAILPYSIDYARFLCYGAVRVTDAAGAAAQAATPECQNLPRSIANGGALTTQVSYANQAIVRTSGIDFTVNWQAALEDMGLSRIPGRVGLNVTGTWLDYYKTKQSAAQYDPVIDWKGSLGPTLQSFNAGSYDYRLLTSLNYNLPSLGVSLRWRHLPKVDAAGRATENAIIANNARVAAGGPGITLSYTPTTAVEIASYDVFDLSGFFNFNETLSLRFGVDNVLDRGPAVTARTLGRPYDFNLTPAQNSALIGSPGSNAGGVCNGAPGCTNPGAYSLPTSGQGTSNGGYYDLLGRRYYVGLKARF